MKSGWSHLPNAKYIDRILAHVKTNHEAWPAAPMCSTAWSAARSACIDNADGPAGRKAAIDAAWDATWSAAENAELSAAGDAILALVSWDHAGALLDLPAEQVRVLALLGQPAAILLYPTVLAMENTQNIRLTNNARTAIMVT
jgi:hypothetical protein